MTEGSLHRLAAFADAPGGGNPAGVWTGEALPSVEEMQRIAADVGYSETAFVAPLSGSDKTIRYFSPEIEVPFCGHATIATGVVLGRKQGPGRYTLDTQVGNVPIEVVDDDGIRVTLESVEPKQRMIDPFSLYDYLDILGWLDAEFDDAIPPAFAYAGAWHLVIAVTDRETLANLDYDFERARQKMPKDDIVTFQLVWRESADTYHCRNPFPVGGVVEDPATGAAAAALGGYLRSIGAIDVPSTLTILQGVDMGRPSRLVVDVPSAGGIRVSGSAAEIE
ncbi:MAG: PhzF family phenazine biosynthesis isomerase [Woeseiaceae bacterium]|nr:PhzF family phenazine biosynthesis isomerase [Woeseiaceae bacterium]